MEQKARYFGRSSFTRWVVPVDDNHCVALAWGNFGERGDPNEYNSKEGCERIEGWRNYGSKHGKKSRKDLATQKL